MTAQPEFQSLNEQLAAANAELITQFPDAAVATMQAAGAKLAASGITEGAVGVGEAAPDFTLPDQNGKPVTLSTLLQKGPVVLSIFRGGWCPYCSIEMKALAGALPAIERAGASLVALSPNTAAATRDTDARLAPGFPLLSDEGATVIERYRLRYVLDEDLRPVYESFGIDIAADNGDTSYYLPIPATYVIGRDGTVAAAYLSADYTTRMEPAEILSALNRL